MRNLWILFSALLVGVIVAVCVASPVDPLHWLVASVLGPAFRGVPAAEPITRYADAALIGALAAYFLIFLPLSAATWVGGGRQARLIRNALTDPSDAPIELLPIDSANPWWPLLAPYAARADEAAGVVGASAAGAASKNGRSPAIDSLVAHQSGATVFGDFPIIALGFGVIALTGQLLPVLAADPGAIAGASRTALGAALARGFSSLLAATAVAALFGLLSRLVAAILRRRAEALIGRLDFVSRRWAEEPSAVAVTPLLQPARGKATRVDEALVENVVQRVAQMPGVSGREMAESVDNAIRELHATTLRPMLHDISRLLSLLGERASQLVATVDDRLAQQAEHTRQILSATQQLSRALGERPAGGSGGGVIATSDLAVDELRQALRDERAAAVALLRSAGEDVVGQLEGAFKSAARSLARPLSAQAEAVRKVVERMDNAAAALSRSGSAIEQTVGAIEQQLARLAAPPQADGSAAGAADMAALMQPLAAQAEMVRQAVERIDGAAEAMARAGGMMVQSSAAIEQRLAALASLPADAGRDGAPAADLAALVGPLASQAEAVRQVVERIDAAATAMTRTGSLIEQSTGAIEQKLERLASLPDAREGDGMPDAAAEHVATLLQPLAAQAEAVRQVVERIDAAATAMTRTGSAVEQASGAIEQQLGRLATIQQSLQDEAPAGAAAEDIATLVQPLWAQTDAVRQVVERMDAAAEAMTRTGSKIEQSTGAIEQKLDRLASVQESQQSAPAPGAAAEDLAALLQPLSAQAEAVRQVVERIDAAAETMARTGSLIEQSTGAIEQKLDRLARAEEIQQSAPAPGAAAEDLAALLQPLSAQADAVRQVVERIDAAAEAMARTGSLIEQSTGAIEQKLDRLAQVQESGKDSAGSAAVADEVAALARSAREALESLALVSVQLKQAAIPLGARDPLLPGLEKRRGSLESGSWSQRIGALHRASIDLTSDLPGLESPEPDAPGESKPAGENEGSH